MSSAWTRLTDELGFDAAVNYRDDGFRDAFKQACGKGIDVYFDNTGGDVLGEVGFEELEARAGRIVMAFAPLLPRANEHSEVDQMHRTPVPRIVQPIGGHIDDSRPRLVPLDDAIDDERIALRAVVVTVDLIDGQSNASLFAGEAVVAEIPLPLETLHGRVMAAILVETVDQIPSHEQTTQITRDRPAAHRLGEPGTGEAVDDFNEPAVGLLGQRVELRWRFGVLRQVLWIAADEEGDSRHGTGRCIVGNECACGNEYTETEE